MLEDFISSNSLKARLVLCARRVATAQQAADFMKVPLDSVAKTVLFLLDGKDPVLCIVSGSSKVSAQKLCKIFGARECRLASPKEIEEITGYSIGAVPPISVYGVPTVLDSKLASKTEIVSGGGSEQHLLCISPSEILGFAFDAKAEDISE